MKRIKFFLSVLFFICLFINVASAQEYEIRNYSSSYFILNNTFNVNVSMNISALYTGQIPVYLGNFIIDEVRVNGQVFTGTISYNTIYLNVVQNNQYHIFVKGHGAISNNEISTSISSGRAIQRIEFNFIFDPNIFPNLYITPTPNQDLSIINNRYTWIYTYRNTASASLKWYQINNSGLSVEMKAVLLVAESNKLKARFSFNSTDYFNRITLILADGTPWQITTPQPTKKYDFYTEFDYGENVTFPKVKDASMHKFSLLIYSYKDYKINFTTSMQELNRYDPGVNALIALLSDLVPSDYSLSGIFKGGPNDTLLIRKTKLEEKPVIATSINNAKFNVFLTTRDFALVKGEYYVVNTELNKYLELEIPKEAIFWGAILDDAPLDVYGEGEKILIPLKTSEKIGSAYSQMHLMFFYVVPNGIFMKGTPDSFIFITPKQNVPVSKVEVKISIPSEFLVLWIETKPSARTKIVSYRPTLMRTPIQIVKYGLGSETSETIGIAKSLSVESPVEKVELTIRGVPIEFQIPESNRYALIEMELLMPSEELSIVLYGQENAWIFFIFIIFIILVITYWKRKIVIKYLKKIW